MVKEKYVCMSMRAFMFIRLCVYVCIHVAMCVSAQIVFGFHSRVAVANSLSMAVSRFFWCNELHGVCRVVSHTRHPLSHVTYLFSSLTLSLTLSPICAHHLYSESQVKKTFFFFPFLLNFRWTDGAEAPKKKKSQRNRKQRL